MKALYGNPSKGIHTLNVPYVLFGLENGNMVHFEFDPTILSDRAREFRDGFENISKIINGELFELNVSNEHVKQLNYWCFLDARGSVGAMGSAKTIALELFENIKQDANYQKMIDRLKRENEKEEETERGDWWKNGREMPYDSDGWGNPFDQN